MAVVLATHSVTATAREHAWRRDARGVPVPTGEDDLTVRGPFPATVLEQADGTWECKLDPRLGPLRQSDELTDDTTVWTITDVPILKAIPGVPTLDFIACNATRNVPVVP